MNLKLFALFRTLILAALKTAVILSSFVFAATAAAATADLEIATSYWPASGSGTIGGTFIVRNNGPDTAGAVRITFTTTPASTLLTLYADSGSCTTAGCNLLNIAPSGVREVSVVADPHLVTGHFKLNATVSSPTDDPNPMNDTLTVETELVEPRPDLMVDLFLPNTSPSSFPPDTFVAEEETFIDVVVRNVGNGMATSVVLTVGLPSMTRVIGTQSDFDACEIAKNGVTCRVATLGSESLKTRIRFLMPPLYGGGTATIHAHVQSAESDLTPDNNDASVSCVIAPTFVVTSTDDEGEGTLRQAIVDANAHCTGGCRVVFRIPGPLPDSGFFTIHPRSPLPVADFSGEIDANTESDFLDVDRKPLRLMLDGSMQAEGDGITITRLDKLKGLAIGNFARFGVYANTTNNFTIELEGVCLGLDAAGQVAPNLRGVVIDNAAWLRVTSSVISGNRRSGIVAAAAHTEVTDSCIGVAPDCITPIPNGASGIYLPGTGTVVISGNVIANHPDFGVALSALPQRQVSISRNQIYNNFGNGIDYGLDGPTPNVADDGRRFPNVPIVTSASFDSRSHQTSIRIQLDTSAGLSWAPAYCPGTVWCYLSHAFAEVELYSNGAPGGQTQRYLGTVKVGDLPLDHRTSVETSLTVGEDLRGQWISAVTIRHRQDCVTDECDTATETSEASPGVPVR